MQNETIEDLEKGKAIDEKDQETTLVGIVTKMKRIAAEQYNGRVFDNIYSIFMQLKVVEKRILLKGLINVLLIVEDKMVDGTLSGKEYTSDVTQAIVQNTVLKVEEHITDNLTQIDLFNKKEMIRLKSRLTVIIVVTLGIGVISMMLAAIYLSSDKAETLGIFTEFGKIVAEILGL